MKFGVSVRHAPEPFIRSALSSSAVDFVEIAGEEFAFRTDKIAKRRLAQILDSKPVSVHGYSLSLLDPQPWNPGRISTYLDFVRSHPFLSLSDHYAISSWKGQMLGSLTPAPTGTGANQVLRTKLVHLRRELPELPFFIENVASPFFLGDARPSLVSHFSSSLDDTHAELLLDISNLVANEINFGINAEDELNHLVSMPIGEVHLAGGEYDRKFFRDSHSSAVTERSWELLKKVAPYLRQDCLILIEREQNHPEWAEIEMELSHARNLLAV